MTERKFDDSQIMAKCKSSKLNDTEIAMFSQFMEQQIVYGNMFREVCLAFDNTMNLLLKGEGQFGIVSSASMRISQGILHNFCLKAMDSTNIS